MHLGITPREAEVRRRWLKKQGQKILIFFSISFTLPFLLYSLFHFHLLASKPRYDRRLEMPVARLQTADALGSAFLISDRYLLTARHVVENLDPGASVQLTFEKAEPPITANARLVWKDSVTLAPPAGFLHDIALLELDPPGALPDDFPNLTSGNSDGVGIREAVVLIGFPGGLMTTTTGRISNDQAAGLDLFQLDVNAWHGNSGGPLIVEESEEVIGVLVAGLTGEFQGINFAIKMNYIRKVLAANGLAVE